MNDHNQTPQNIPQTTILITGDGRGGGHRIAQVCGETVIILEGKDADIALMEAGIEPILYDRIESIEDAMKSNMVAEAARSIREKMDLPKLLGPQQRGLNNSTASELNLHEAIAESIMKIEKCHELPPEKFRLDLADNRGRFHRNRAEWRRAMKKI